MKFDIFNRNTGALQFTAEIDAVVLEIAASGEVISLHDMAAIYRPGEFLKLGRVDNIGRNRWNPDWRVECSGPIHFYLTEAHK